MEETLPGAGKGEKDGVANNLMEWFRFGMLSGFTLSFWVVIIPLSVYRTWRRAYYSFLGSLYYKISRLF